MQWFEKLARLDCSEEVESESFIARRRWKAITIYGTILLGQIQVFRANDTSLLHERC